MVHYKLYYFPFRGLAEPIRMMLHMANIEFEDIRIPFESLKDYKDVTPFGKLPVLDVDGVMLPQSLAICRYVARKTGLAGKTELEVALADAISEQAVEFFVEWTPFRMINYPYGDTDEENREKIRKEVFVPACERYFGYMTDYLKKSKTGFLAGGELTFVDLQVAELVNNFLRMAPEISDKFSELHEHRKRIHAFPGLQKWLQERPENQF